MSSKKAVFAAGLVLFAASLACTNPITSYFSTQTAVMQTATATMWTPTPTNTPTITPTPTSTFTPTATLTPTLDPRYYYETAGRVNFSYIPPKGWRKLSISGSDLRGWSGPGNTQLGFYDERNTGSAAEAAGDTEAQLKAVVSGLKIQDSGELNLASGLDNAWFSFTGSIQGLSVYATIYLFSDGDNTVVYGMYLRTPGANEDQDSIIVDSLSTFRFDQ